MEHQGHVERLAEQVTMQGAVRRVDLLRCAMRGMNAKQAAEAMKLPYQTVVKIYAERDFRVAALEKLEEVFGTSDSVLAEAKMSLHERIKRKAEDAFERLCEIMDNPDTPKGLVVKVATDLLDRNPETQPGYSVTSKTFDPDQLKLAAVTAGEMDNVLPFKKKEAM